MPVTYAVLFIAVSTIAVSYGWGMRGTTIGGEKGAMLPGAIMGLLIAVFSGSELLLDNFFFLSALGSMGMFFGGCMTYGETLGLSMSSRPAADMKRGLTALFIKGFLWFGVFALFVSVGLAAISGQYFSVNEIAVMFLLMPVTMITFMFIFNKPHNPDKGIFPKIYFSVTRQESWGAMLGLFAELFIISVIKRIDFAVKFTLVCAAFGAVGWVIGQLMQIYCRQYSKDSKNRFLKMWSSPSIDSWKIMECILGAFGGLGASVAVVVFFDDFKTLVSALESHGIWNPIANCSEALTLIFVGLIAADTIHYTFKSKKLLSAAEILEFPLYAAIPLLLVFLGNSEIAKLSSFFIIFWVFAQEVSFEKPKKLKHSAVFKLIFSVIGVIIIALQLIYGYSFGITGTILLYGVFYEFFTLAYLLPKYNKATASDFNNSFMRFLFTTEIGTVHTYFSVCIAVFTAFILMYN